MANYQQWLVETGCQPNYLPQPWAKPRARPNAKSKAKLREACKRRWEGEGQDEYGPYSYDPYYYEGRKATMVILTAVLAGRTGAFHFPSGLVSRDAIQ